MFEFATPWLFFLLPLPWLLRWLLPAATIGQPAALKVPFFAEIAALEQQHSHHFAGGIVQQVLAGLIWLLLVTAAAGPQWLGAPLPLPREGRDILMAIDISGSMRIPDMRINDKPVDRLTALKHVATDFIAQRQGDRLGLIIFGSRAYMQTPLTFDRATVQNMLNDASIGLAGQQTAIGDAIGLAIKRLMNLPEHDRILILLTDGSNNSGHVDPLEAAQLAARYGIRIYTIGIGADEVVVSDFFGPQRVNLAETIDEASLQQIAQATGGRYFRAKDVAGLQQIYEQLNQLEPIAQTEEWLHPMTALYYWPLGAALLLSALWGCASLRRSIA